MLSDEEIVATVLKCGTVLEAGNELGVSASTIYRRMRKSSAQALYRSLQTDLLRQTVEDLREARDDALKVIQDIMNDPTVNDAIRLQAAQAILKSDIRYSERLAQVEVEADEMYIKADAEDVALKMVKQNKKLDEQRLKRLKY